MKLIKTIYFLLLTLFSFTSIECQEKNGLYKPITNQFAYKTFNDWYQTCKTLPYYRFTGKDYANKSSCLTEQELRNIITIFSRTMESNLTIKKEWVDQKSLSETFFKNPFFQPFAQKICLNQGSQVAFHGDLHGDVHSLVEYLKTLKDQNLLDNKFRLTKKNFYLIFLGDYVDRGNFGIEVIYTLLRLKIANPQQVFMVRGNHEDYNINLPFGFGEEIRTKFDQKNNDLLQLISKIYEFMPVVLYIGSETDFIQCNHGGMEIGYLPHNLIEHPTKMGYELIEKLNRNSNWKKYIKKYDSTQQNFTPSNLDLEQLIKKDFQPDDPFQIGFLWNDFIVNPRDYLLYNKNRGYEFGKKITQAILKASSTNNKKVIGVFRAHQHGDPAMMNLILSRKTLGVGKLWGEEKTGDLWEGIVATFNVTPDTAYGLRNKFNFDTYGLLTIGKQFPQGWKFQVFNIDVVPKNL